MKKALYCFVAVVIVLAAASSALAVCSFGEPRPTVISTDPTSDATGVALNKIIRITFDLDMDDSTINTTNIRVRNTSTGNDIAGTVTYDPSGGGTAIFTPAANLQPNTRYRVRAYDNVRADNDCRMSNDYTFYFTTGAAAGDTTPPTVIAVSPAHNSTGNPVSTTLTINFSEAMDASTMTTNNITLVDNSGATVTGTVSYIAVSHSATFTPSANLAPNTIYTANVKTPQIKDASGNGLDVSNTPVTTVPPSYQWTFRTLITDTTKPTVTAVSPLNNATGVSVSTSVTATFSEALDPSTVTTSTFTLKAGATSITGTVTYDAALDQAIFTPSGTLSNSTTYTATLTTGIKDVAGNTLANFVWSFTTAALIVPAAMENFCQTPAFITTGSRVKPNVLLIVDNSGSMSEFAYKAKGKGSSTWDDSYDSAADYYGYFDNKHMYTYVTTSGGYFTMDTAAGLDRTSFWSGNFLNWLTMRRVDVVRKILVGGKTSPRSASTANYLIGYESPDRDNLKSYASKYYEIDKGNPYGQIGVCNSSSCGSYTATYSIKVYVGNNPPDEGIIIKMADKIRFGIEFFNDGYRFENSQNSVKDGGFVGVDIGSTGTNLITQIENTDPSTWTPLGEALYEATRYFEAADSAYNGGTYNGKDPIEYPCQKNFVLLLTDGESTKDQNLPGGAFSGTEISDIANGNFNVQTYMDKIRDVEILSNPAYTSQKATSANTSDGTYYLEAVAYWAHTTDLRRGATDPLGALGKSDISGKQNMTIYTVFAFDDSPVGRDLLQKTAKYGGYTERDSIPGPNLTSEWSKKVAGTPDTYFEASSGGAVGDAIQAALNDILAQVASGTATSILSSSEGSGATIMQAIFYPQRIFTTSSSVNWIGEVQNMWYFLDPRLNNSRVREDTNGDFKLNLASDYIVSSRYDPTDGQTKVDRYLDTDGDGSPDSATALDTVSLDTLKSLWKAGKRLLTRDVSVAGSERTLYTNIDGASLTNFRTLITSATGAELTRRLTLLQATNTVEGTKIIDYTHGIDQAGYRSRTVSVCSGNSSMFCTDNATCSAAGAGTCDAKVWKLGDIISSTPKVQSKFPLNTYQTSYGDKSYDAFIKSTIYKGRGTAYVGANDGMLHAIRFGTLDQTMTGSIKAKLCDNPNSDGTCPATMTTSNLGAEQWAFIPNNALPYLKYLADPNYCHIYTVDLTPTLFDASIGNTSCTVDAATRLDSTDEYWDCPKFQSDGTPYTAERWRTILVGGMRLGGGCKNPSYTGSQGLPVPLGVCSNNPATTCSSNANCTAGETCDGSGGYSSYFALDVTDPTTPTLLWEFVPPAHDLGLATSGPAIIRINARDKDGTDPSKVNKDKNGRWFAVFASGPTGPIDATTGQFKGFSDQPLKLFILDLKTGALLRTIDTGIANAFGGSLYNSNIDYDLDYQDDALYLGYSQAEAAINLASTKWNAGGVLRLVTKAGMDGNTTAGTALDPANWTVSSVISGTGPTTSAITHLAHYPVISATTPDNAFLYFGTGRYFYTIPTGSDDTTAQRKLFGVKEPCLTSILKRSNVCSNDPAKDCTVAADCGGGTCGACPSLDFSSSDGGLTEAATGAGTTDEDGWFINLPISSGSLYSERIITDPLATSIGAVFFTSFAPSTDVCSFGGQSYLWAVKYDTGGSIAGSLKGKGLLQLSTGAIEEIDLKTAFGTKTDAATAVSRGGRRTVAMQGAPPTGQGLSIVVPPKPVDTIMHIRKK